MASHCNNIAAPVNMADDETWNCCMCGWGGWLMVTTAGACQNCQHLICEHCTKG
jgi:hypothetical protein